jgi:hypothetical protein
VVKNRNTDDFRVVAYNGTPHLSAILHPLGDDWKGHGIIMNSSFATVQTIQAPKPIKNFNMHELNIIEDGRTALHIIAKPDRANITELGTGKSVGWIANHGFREMDIATGKTTFEWWALDHVPLSASSVLLKNLDGPLPKSWNFL